MNMRIAALALAAFAGAGSANAATLLNGSFETPVQTNAATGGLGYSYNPTGGAWTFAGGSGITRNNTAWGFTPAPDGNQVAFLQNISSISQVLTGLVVGQKYQVTFDLSNRPGYALNTVTAAFDGGTLATYTPSNPWTSEKTRFTATAATGTLSFSTNIATGDHDSGLDRVTIAAVPESATWAMMVIGFGAVGGAMRRRQRVSVRFA